MAEKQSQSQPNQPATGGQGAAYDDLAQLIRSLSLSGGLPVALSTTPPTPIDTGKRLTQRPEGARRTVVFPPCSDELLGLKAKEPSDITAYFSEYFKFQRHNPFGQFFNPSTNQFEELDTQLAANLDPALTNCVGTGDVLELSSGVPLWPTECCVCSPCVTLDGNRNELRNPVSSPFTPSIKRLFIGDLLWLFYFEQLGIFQILGVILDAFAYNGRLPISAGAVEPRDIRDDLVALVLEIMVRQTKMGMSSTVRDRASAYRTCLGWVSSSGRKLSLDTQVNTGFSALFHKLIYHALEFYRDKRLAVAIQGTAAAATPPSVATLITLSDTIDVLKRRFEAFDYGRNYYNTLSGIVWAIAGMSMIGELRATLGIPPAFNAPDEFIPAAYDILVLKRPVTHGDVNRYLVHKELAQSGRDILLDLEVIDHKARNPGQELEAWLTQVEAKVEGYRTAYRTLTGQDLGAGPTPTIEQKV